MIPRKNTYIFAPAKSNHGEVAQAVTCPYRMALSGGELWIHNLEFSLTSALIGEVAQAVTCPYRMARLGGELWIHNPEFSLTSALIGEVAQAVRAQDS